MQTPATEQAIKERAEKDRKEGIKERQEVLDLYEIMRFPYGRRFLRRLLKTCLHGQDASDPSSSRVYQKLGKQMVGRELEKWMKETSLDNFFLLLKEGENEVKSKKSEKGGTDGT